MDDFTAWEQRKHEAWEVEQEARRQEAEAFATLMQDLTVSLELDPILTRLVAQARELSQGDAACLAEERNQKREGG